MGAFTTALCGCSRLTAKSSGTVLPPMQTPRAQRSTDRIRRITRLGRHPHRFQPSTVCHSDEPPTRNQAQKTAHSPAPTARGGHTRWTQVDTQCTFVNIASQIHISHVQLDDLFTVRGRLRRAGKDCQCRYVQQL